MCLIKDKKSPNYQIVYFLNGKRTTASTKTKYKKEAEKFLITFNTTEKPNLLIEKVTQKELHSGITLLDFKEEYLSYVTPTKSLKYIDSIEFSFRQFSKHTGNIFYLKLMSEN